jgi:putative transposase
MSLIVILKLYRNSANIKTRHVIGAKYVNVNSDIPINNSKSDTEQVATALHDYYDGGSSVRAIGRHILAETGNTPSTATIYEWIQKYTQYITDSIRNYHPRVGDKWIADETIVKIGGQNVWLWDLIDSDTRVLLASRLSESRTAKDAQILVDRAIKTAGKHPKIILTDKLHILGCKLRQGY